MQRQRPQWNQSFSKRQKTDNGYQGKKNTEFIEATCEVCGDEGEIVQREVQKDGPNKGMCRDIVLNKTRQ